MAIVGKEEDIKNEEIKDAHWKSIIAEAIKEVAIKTSSEGEYRITTGEKINLIKELSIILTQ